MELKSKYKVLLRLFDATAEETFSDCIRRVLDSPSRNSYFDKYIETFPDLSKDELRSCWQFWFADRDEKKQDYTPEPLADLCARVLTMADGKTLYDCCAGTGALTIATWNIRKDIRVTCQEIDEDVIPLLLFNLAIRNIGGTVRQGNALSDDENARTWELTPGDRYSMLSEQMFPTSFQAELAISNPPYNIYKDGHNLNFDFIARCTSIASRAVVLLPCGTLTNKADAGDRARLLDAQLLQACILLPDRLFESTGIPVAMYVLDRRQKDSACLVDATTLGEEYFREQRGEGSRPHTERIYKKKMVRFSDTQIAAIQRMTEEGVGVSLKVSYDDIRAKDCNFAPGPYKPIEIDAEHSTHRSFTDIIDNINECVRMQNTCKLTINQVWAKELDLEPLLQLAEEDKKLVNEINRQLAMLGIEKEITAPSWIAQTNSKELKIVQQDKEYLSPAFYSFLPFWKQHIRTMNEFQNALYRELRDALLEPLMTGRITLNTENA